jgi:WD40 repeat protein
VEFSRDGTRMAACGADRTIRIFDVAERREVRRIEAHADWVMSIAWNPDGSKLASASRDKSAKVIDAATGTVLVTYPGHDEQVHDVVFSSDGENVFSAGRGRELHRWVAAGDDSTKKDVRSKVTGAIVGRTRGEIFKLAILGSHVLAVSGDGKLTAFDAQPKDKREPAMVYEGAPQQAFAMAIHEPTKRIVVGGFDGRVMLYEIGDSAPWNVLIAAPRTSHRPEGPKVNSPGRHGDSPAESREAGD